LIAQLKSEVFVPGQDSFCGIAGVTETKALLQYRRDGSKKCFNAGPTSLDAAQRIEFGPAASGVPRPGCI
jgi:hypothetical protein